MNRKEQNVIVEEIERRNGEAMVWMGTNHPPEVWDRGHTPQWAISVEEDSIVACVRVSVDIHDDVEDWRWDVLHQIHATIYSINSTEKIRCIYRRLWSKRCKP